MLIGVLGITHVDRAAAMTAVITATELKTGDQVTSVGERNAGDGGQLLGVGLGNNGLFAVFFEGTLGHGQNIFVTIADAPNDSQQLRNRQLRRAELLQAFAGLIGVGQIADAQHVAGRVVGLKQQIVIL